MAIVESFHPAIELGPQNGYDHNRAIREYKGCVIRREMPEGLHDVTDHRATQTNQWMVDVHSKGGSIVYIIPTRKDSRVSLAGLPLSGRAGGARVTKDSPVQLAGITSERKWSFLPFPRTHKVLLYRQVVVR